MRARRAKLIFPLATLALLFSGCASYSDSFSVIESDMAAQRFGAALETLERQRHPQRDRLLYLLNKAMLERMNGDYAASNRTFEAAKAGMEELRGLSLREQGQSLLINDATRSYAGEEFEQVLVHLYMALNYLQLGERIDARVEALQVDERLREITQRLPENRYTEDALARYLTGMIYEELGERSDAMIAYRKAYEAYRRYQQNYLVAVPDFLKHDLLRLSQQMGLTEEMRQYKKEFRIERWMSADELAEQGELIFLLHNGLAPIRREHAVTIPDPASGHLVRIAVPYYETRPTPMTGARAVVKAQMAKAARENARQQNQNNAGAAVAAVAVEIAGLVTERADTRSWLTLPSRIHLARLPLPPGTYTVKVDLLGADGRVVSTREYANMVIRRGAKTYLSPHWIPSSVPTARRSR